MALQVVLGLRYNILSVIFGISFERALFWHRIVAIVVLICGCLHGYSEWEVPIDSSGFALLFLMGLMSFVYSLKYFNINFEAFYYLHILLYCGCFVAAVAHGATLFAVAAGAWALDLLLRYVVWRNPVDAQLELLSCDVIRVTFPKSFSYEAGQYAFLMVPELSMFQFHVST